MNETANLYNNIYDHVVSSRINGSDEAFHDERLGKNKWVQERKSINGNKVSKMKDFDWFQRLIEFAASIAGNIKWTRVNEHGVCHGDMGAQRGVSDAKQLHQFSCVEQCVKIFTPEYETDNNCCLDQNNQQSNILGNQRSPVINKTNEVERDDMTSIWSILEENNCFFNDGNGEVEDNVTNTDSETDLGTNLENDCISSKIATCMSSSVSINDSSRMQMNNEFNENSKLRNDVINKDVKIAELLMQLKLAQHTINQQQCVIRDLEKKLGNIVENVVSRPRNEENNMCMEMSQLELHEAIKLIHTQTDRLKNNGSLIEELKASETRLKLELEDTKEQRNTLEDSIDILRGVIDQLQVNNFLFESQIGLVSDTDVLILHDSFLKHIKTDLFEKQQLIMDNILCHHLSDALLHLQTYKEKPEVVIVHTGTNDLTSLQVEEMCNIVTDIHACVTNNGMKLIICNITPSYEQSELARKVHLFNSNISYRLGAYDNVTICKSNDLNDQGILSQEYGNGRTHDKKTKSPMRLRRNKRFSPYQSRGKENYIDNRQTVKDTFYKQSRTG